MTIIVDNVYKRYQTDHGMGKWVLSGVSLTIPANTNVGLVGRNGAGKSTLLRLIGGVDQPSRGRVVRDCRVSWPLGFSGGLPATMTGRQSAKFICRIHGFGEEEIAERLRHIQEFAELPDAFDEPVKTYSPGMRSRLAFAISLAFDFDVYLSDEVTAAGDAIFKKKAKEAFARMADRAGLIMVSHAEGVLKEFCTAGIWLHEGRAHWFDKIDDALDAYNESIGETHQEAAPPEKGLAGQVRQVNGAIRGWATNRITGEIVSVDVLVEGKPPVTIEAREPRANLKTLGVNSTGIGGFGVSLAELGAGPGETVRIVFTGTQQDLKGSPLQVG